MFAIGARGVSLQHDGSLYRWVETLCSALMEHVRNWLLPVALGAGWVALSPVLVSWVGTPMSKEEFVVGSAASVVAAIALGFRRHTPLATLAVVTVVTVLGQFATSQEGLGVLPAELVALYSVAVRCQPAVGRRATAALIAVKTLATLGAFGLGPDFALDAVGNLVLYVVILAGGQNRQRRLAGRDQDARELRDAEERGRNAAATERHRLARELHDVSAHHLTSIVVSGGAAERLVDRQPELAAEALTHAAETGRETLVSLRRLVAVLEIGERDQDEPLGGRIAELAEAFTRLGQQVLVEVTPEVSAPASEAVFGIVRESLTNTLRHAPGSAVRVVVSREGGRINLLVENGQATGAPSAGQGSGRGIAGMRERAEALGGTLTAGPGPDNTWQVKGSLLSPTTSISNKVGVSAVDRWLAEVGVAVAVTAVAVGGTAGLIAEDFPSADAATVSLALLLALVPGLVLLGRRDRPWTVLAGVAATAGLWPVAIGFDLLPDGFAPALVMCIGAPMAAVYAVAAYGGGAAETWPSVPAAAGGVGAAAAALALVTPRDEETAGWGFAIFLMVMVSIALGILLLGWWAAGALVRRRRNRRLDHSGRALAELVRAAEAEVHAERQRVASGLHHSVLTRTSRMITLAEADDLEGVTTEARSALTAMRELLETLDEPGTPAPRTPQLTATDKELL
jgi:signal transduction histidine kinase